MRKPKIPNDNLLSPYRQFEPSVERPEENTVLNSDNESSTEESKFREAAIDLERKRAYSKGMDAANAALLSNRALVGDAKFVFALVRCSAALGDIQTSLMGMQVLSVKNPACSQ